MQTRPFFVYFLTVLVYKQTMQQSGKTFAAAGALGMAVAIGLGAFGAHALRESLSPRMIEVYQTAVLYHLVHSIGLFAVAQAAHYTPRAAMVRAAGWTMIGGTVIFSGSLYLLAATGIRWLGAMTPIGGIALIAAWAFLAAALIRGDGRTEPPRDK